MQAIDIRARDGAEFELPAEYAALRELAYNLWWTWSARSHRLFHAIDARHWLHYRNPVELLINVTPRRWEQLRHDEPFAAAYREVIEEFRLYQSGVDHGWFRHLRPDYQGGPVVYFSTEFGWHECLRSYSGGLGILSGDHSKAASDLALPFVGVGLLYRRGYFQQTIDVDGDQQHFYPRLDPDRLPLRPVLGRDGEELRVSADFPDHPVMLRVWKATVGRVPVLLLDADTDENDEADRQITSMLYVSGREMRLCQELLLGIGGVRTLDALGIEPALWHINEGHSALLAVERMRRRIERDGTDLEGARKAVAANAIFTTHTPVPAGNESFDTGLVQRYLEPYAAQAGVEVERLLELGRAHPDDGGQFNMTAFAIRTSAGTNGVSELHGRVADGLWRHMWAPGEQDAERRYVTHVTNGVHIATWLGPEIAELLARHLGREFMLNLADPGFEQAVRGIPDHELWESHLQQKRRLLVFARERMLDQVARHGRAPGELRAVETLLRPDALTIGFARRFATYKRADLPFRDPERLRSIVCSEDRPVQLLFAGKAHPADRPGQDLIRRIWEISHRPEFLGRVLYLENYGMRIARTLVQGVDLWLNTPRRPQEASGTSGMKAAANGALNFSILDGWWAEGHDPAHGWAIGADDDAGDAPDQDDRDAGSLYAVLADQIVPSYYRRDEDGVPREWIGRMKASIATLLPRFSASRMVREYAERFYFPREVRDAGDDRAAAGSQPAPDSAQ